MAKTKKKPKSNPRIAPKKKKTKAELRRSEAAKKGHQTRRINELAAVKAASFKLKAKAGRVKKKLSESGENKALKKQIVELREKARAYESKVNALQKKLSDKWVHLQDEELLHRDGTLALFPSRIRHMKKAEIFRKGLLDIQRMDGERALTEAVRYWATEWDVPIQEFYTLILSP